MAAMVSWRNDFRLALTCLTFGLIQIIFISTQVYVLGSAVFLHGLFFVIGLVQGFIGLRLFYKNFIKQN